MQARAAVSRIVGVDRLDYTKGLPQKFKAFGRLPRQVSAVPAPGRAHTDRAADAGERRGLFRYPPELESLAGSINGRFGELDWVPIHYIHRSTPRRRLGDIYRSSRICMVTPLRDGMNLVAKEYVAAQDADDPGVLILSHFAGAAEEMTEALIVNPYNIEETADVIRVALEMSLDERRERHGALMAGVRSTMSRRGRQSFLAQLERVRGIDDPSTWTLAEPIRGALKRLHHRATRGRAGASRRQRGVRRSRSVHARGRIDRVMHGNDSHSESARDRRDGRACTRAGTRDQNAGPAPQRMYR